MIRILLCISFIALFTACTKMNGTATVVLSETIPGSALKTGAFVNGPHGTVTGSAHLYLQEGKYFLKLENVAISNGPDLHVYLSQELQPLNFIDLGKLKSTAGDQVYPVNGHPDFAVYKYALVHCQQYNHLFGSAALQ